MYGEFINLPKNLIIKYRGKGEHLLPYQGLYIHKPKSFNKDIYVKQTKIKDDCYCTVYWYFNNENHLGAWRLTFCRTADGMEPNSEADPESVNYGKGNFYAEALVPMEEKYNDTEADDEDEFLVKFYE